MNITKIDYKKRRKEVAMVLFSFAIFAWLIRDSPEILVYFGLAFAICRFAGECLKINKSVCFSVALAITGVLYCQAGAHAMILETVEDAVLGAVTSTGGAVDEGLISAVFDIVRAGVVLLFVGLAGMAVKRFNDAENYAPLLGSIFALAFLVVLVEAAAFAIFGTGGGVTV